VRGCGRFPEYIPPYQPGFVDPMRVLLYPLYPAPPLLSETYIRSAWDTFPRRYMMRIHRFPGPGHTHRRVHLFAPQFAQSALQELTVLWRERFEKVISNLLRHLLKTCSLGARLPWGLNLGKVIGLFCAIENFFSDSKYKYLV